MSTCHEYSDIVQKSNIHRAVRHRNPVTSPVPTYLRTRMSLHPDPTAERYGSTTSALRIIRDHTLGNSARSPSMDSPQQSNLSNPTNFASLPWLRLSRIAALTSPAVFILCEGDNRSLIAGGTSGEDSNARRAIVFSSSDRNSGLSSPLGASSSCAN